MTQWEHEIIELNGEKLKAIFRICRTDTNPKIGMGFYYPKIRINKDIYATREEATDAMRLYIADMPKEEKDLHCVTAGWVPLLELECYTFVTPNWCFLPPDTIPFKFVFEEIYKTDKNVDIEYYEVKHRNTKRMTLQNLHEEHTFSVEIETDDQENEYCHIGNSFALKSENLTF